MKKRFLAILSVCLSFAFGAFGLMACNPDDTQNGADAGENSAGGVQNSVGTEGLKYQLISGREEYCVVGIENDAELDVVIPSVYNGLPVTKIQLSTGNPAPNSILKNLTSVKIPNSVTAIGNNAFAYCSSLTSMEIPDSVTNLGAFAFTNCTGLKSVTVGSGVTAIAEETFSNCTLLTEVKLSDSVESIGTAAFCECDALEDINIPAAVTAIGGRAFFGCDGLTEVVVPDLVENIDYRAFYNCVNLERITIGGGVTSFGEGVLRYCNKLTSISFNGTKSQWDKIEKGYSWVNSDSNVKIVCTDMEFTLS